MELYKSTIKVLLGNFGPEIEFEVDCYRNDSGDEIITHDSMQKIEEFFKKRKSRGE